MEDVVGFALPVVRWVRGGMDALLGSRIATPGFCLARFDARRAWGRPCAGAMAWRCVVA